MTCYVAEPTLSLVFQVTFWGTTQSSTSFGRQGWRWSTRPRDRPSTGKQLGHLGAWDLLAHCCWSTGPADHVLYGRLHPAFPLRPAGQSLEGASSEMGPPSNWPSPGTQEWGLGWRWGDREGGWCAIVAGGQGGGKAVKVGMGGALSFERCSRFRDWRLVGSKDSVGLLGCCLEDLVDAQALNRDGATFRTSPGQASSLCPSPAHTWSSPSSDHTFSLLPLGSNSLT